MAISKLQGATTEKQGSVIKQPNSLNVLMSGHISYGSRGTVTLDSTYVAYRLVLRIEHNLDNRLFKNTNLTVIGDKYSNITGENGEATVSNFIPWNAGGLYWSDGSSHIHQRRSSLLQSRYLYFTWTFRVLTAGSVAFTTPNGNISWKILDVDTASTQGGMGAGGSGSAKYYYLDNMYFDVNGNSTDVNGVVQASPTVYTSTVQYGLDASLADTLWKYEPNNILGDIT